jgi:hypothetical protein
LSNDIHSDESSWEEEFEGNGYPGKDLTLCGTFHLCSSNLELSPIDGACSYYQEPNILYQFETDQGNPDSFMQ